MSFLFKRLKLYPVLASFVAVKSVAHHQVNPVRNPRKLVGPEPPVIMLSRDEKSVFKRVMTEAAERAQRFMVAEASRAHIPGISYSVAVGDADPFVSSYGFADIENNIQLQDNSRLRIGLISMLFTACLGWQLVKDAKIGLTDDVGSILEGFPKRIYRDRYYTITLSHLLRHTSGTRDFTAEELLDTRNETPQMFYDKFLAESAELELNTAPGTYSFSTIGYMLILTMIEAAYTQLFEARLLAFMRECYARRFRVPVSMVDDTITILPGLSRHYQRNCRGVLEPANYVNPFNRLGAYGIVAEPSFLCYLGHSIARSTQDFTMSYRPRNTYNVNLNVEMARRMFQPITDGPEEAKYDVRSQKLIHNCIFGECLAEEHNTRAPMAWNWSSIIGSSSILLVKGAFVGSQRDPSELSRPCPSAFVPPDFKPYQNLRPGSKPFTGTDITVAVTCNLQGLHLFKLANEIAGCYEEAYEEFQRWQRSRIPPRRPGAAGAGGGGPGPGPQGGPPGGPSRPFPGPAEGQPPKKPRPNLPDQFTTSCPGPSSQYD